MERKKDGRTMITRDLILAQMRALLRGHGCLDAAAAAINARWGESVCKGTLSRRAHGEQPWPLHHVIALEDALGRYPVTRLMWRRTQDELACPDVVSAARSVAKEAGEAVAAMTGAVLSASAEERARAAVEIDEAIEAMRQARVALEHGNADEATIPFRGVVR